MRVIFSILFSAFLFLPLISFAIISSSTNFQIIDPVIVPGAGFGTSTSFQVNVSLGQPAIGFSTSSNFIIKGGFLYFSAAATSAPQEEPSSPQAVPVEIAPPGGAGRPLPRPKPPKEAINICDFNKDNKCDLIDLSIILYYYGETGASIERYDLNKDSRVGFIDISILFYYWTE